MTILKKLQDAKDLEDLAKILGFSPKGISYIIYKLEENSKYKKFKIKKSHGGEREICAPIEPLKTLQRRLANVLYASVDSIEAEKGINSTSHGFRRGHSIISNARKHKRRRYVLNLDLKDFFPTFNFGRVRGFFISDNRFGFHENVATLISQIACHENSLPQGSPCSPIIADLIANILDARLVRLAKDHKVTYSRYADDITFSTSLKKFPAALAQPVAGEGPDWKLADPLTKAIEGAGFKINPDKTRMQFRDGRQLVTGLTVNDKVNIRPEYYRYARSMCHQAFKSGKYYRPSKVSVVGEKEPEMIESLNPLEGILSHIHHVKDTIDVRIEPEKRRHGTAARQLYRRFLIFKKFVCLDQPLVICEGKTDSIYLKCALRKLTPSFPELAKIKDEKFTSKISFFNYTGRVHSVLELGGGTEDLKFFFIKTRYHEIINRFGHKPLQHPVIVLIDNDDGAKGLFKTIKQNFGITIDLQSDDKFYHITDNLYLVKTIEKGESGKSCIEDCFEPSLLETKVKGKKFNSLKYGGASGGYGKFVFAEQVVRPNADKIDFNGFKPLLERITAAIVDYKSRVP
ncbi:retron Ec67 family RNA-directed DNA polymerase/endonuclease [Oricola thermophila]|uniref:RNA-directed DNA polymerase n=1 Tax=Oricola thermophila TaxID=2742145 RepID=A0A6N1VE71_9HYPH|nr:retron Ec67 family RNA-directed DNA polymerase/endonuclease [Oricola thermophila]QKV17512.1 RNA-directed DNA polymerase [Oricola thermophila]